MPLTCLYLGGFLKHGASGANGAFMVCAQALQLRPMLTGWLADLATLPASSAGVSLGSEVGYTPGFSLQGGTPGFAPALLLFVEVMRRWQDRGVSVAGVHAHVMALHRRFLQGLPDTGPVSWASLHCQNDGKPQREEIRSNTLVFDQESSVAAAEVTRRLLTSRHVAVDSRKRHLRVGFGFNHSLADVDRLTEAIRSLAEH